MSVTPKKRAGSFSFGRYEASQVGSPFIDTEHLLLGILRDDKELIHRVQLNLDIDSARREMVSSTEPREQSTSLDLPLSDHAKRALAYAAEEAKQLCHRHIGTQHLLLGLLRDDQFASAKVLARFGASLDTLRKKVDALGDPYPHLRPHVAAPRHPLPPTTVEIHGIRWNVEQVRAAQARCRESFWHWEHKVWKPRDVITNKDAKTFSFDLTLAERSPEEFVLVPGGWKKDHCAICSWELFESDDTSHNAGFTNGREWLYTECHHRFIAGDFFASSYSDIT